MPQDYRDHLGDAVYADYDGFHVILTTPSHNGCLVPPPDSTIYLEPRVLEALDRYRERIKLITQEKPA